MWYKSIIETCHFAVTSRKYLELCNEILNLSILQEVQGIEGVKVGNTNRHFCIIHAPVDIESASI